jgi:hypothetical protein
VGVPLVLTITGVEIAGPDGLRQDMNGLGEKLFTALTNALSGELDSE